MYLAKGTVTEREYWDSQLPIGSRSCRYELTLWRMSMSGLPVTEEYDERAGLASVAQSLDGVEQLRLNRRVIK